VKYFLIVYDQMAGSVERLEAFEDRAIALDVRFRLEQEFRDSPAIEVIVLGAQDESDLVRTHARYFRSVSELAFGD
jgi:hypothetical protein